LTYQFIPRYYENKLVCISTIGTHGDIFPEDPEVYQWMQADLEVTIGIMQREFTRKIVDIWFDELSEEMRDKIEIAYENRIIHNYTIKEVTEVYKDYANVVIEDENNNCYYAQIMWKDQNLKENLCILSQQ
jgi:bifunctional DNase/RNase